MSVPQDATPAMTSLLRRVTGRESFRIQPLASGGNNRVFRAEADGDQWLLKEYFRHAGDTRDRLGAEYGFLSFAWGHGVRCIPKPLGCDTENALGLYEYVGGRALMPEDIGPSAIEAALRFWQDVNKHREGADARLLPNGSEACFKIGEHLDCLERRVDALRVVEGGSTVQNEAQNFIATGLIPGSSTIIAAAKTQARVLELKIDRPLDLSERCISPSDFGFHNALIDQSGALRFLDFEYAGWDDPAKMVCDFFCQPAIPVPSPYADMFVRTVSAGLGKAEGFQGRVRILLPVYRLKWCCIMLNDFLPVGGRRRSFAREGIITDEHKARQLQKAKAALEMALE